MRDFPRPRRIGAVNWLGLWTLYAKEVHRFLKIYTQTLMAPVVTTLIFLAIFVLALGRDVEMVAGVPFTRFLAPGLVMMAIAQNAFANGSTSIVIGKIQGNIVDVLMPPLSPAEVMLGFVGGALTRGLLVGVSTSVAMALFAGFSLLHPLTAAVYAFLASLMLSLIGVITGLWAEKFDHTAGITNFVITPLAFLSGTFYSIERLPETFRLIAQFNPFFYMIDGFRYAVIDHSDAPIALGLAVLIGSNLLLLAFCWRLFATGYKLKA